MSQTLKSDDFNDRETQRFHPPYQQQETKPVVNDTPSGADDRASFIDDFRRATMKVADYQKL